jgi:hypothetical protein
MLNLGPAAMVGRVHAFLPERLALGQPPGTSRLGCPSAAHRARRAVLPSDLYPVFPPQRDEPAVTRADRSAGAGAGSKWQWERTPGAGAEPVIPEWNPRTGFTKPARPEAVPGSAGAEPTACTDPPAQAPELEVSVSLLAPRGAAAERPAAGGGNVPLPPVTREQVLGSAAATGGSMLLLALLLRAYAGGAAARVLGTDPQLLAALLRVPAGLEAPVDAGVMLAAAGTVTAARSALLRVWPALAEATARSNGQVLAPLGLADVAAVAVLSGVPEELLFRCLGRGPGVGQ